MDPWSIMQYYISRPYEEQQDPNALEEGARLLPHDQTCFVYSRYTLLDHKERTQSILHFRKPLFWTSTRQSQCYYIGVACSLSISNNPVVPWASVGSRPLKNIEMPSYGSFPARGLVPRTAV